MNKKESGAAQFVTEHRQRSSGRLAYFPSIASSVGKGLTLISLSVNASVAHPLDGLLLGDIQRWKQRN